MSAEEKELREEDIINEIRNTFLKAKKFFGDRNRPILATDIECHLRFFEDALKFDRLDEQDFPVSTTVN